jgi:hypothetical protein
MEGFGSALKPAVEPITMAKKPISEKNMRLNVLKWGVGGINIDGSRVGSNTVSNGGKPNTENNRIGAIKGYTQGTKRQEHNYGRFPANLIHDGSDEVVSGFPSSRSAYKNIESAKKNAGKKVNKGSFGGSISGMSFNDSGSAARYFYCAKASKRERLLNGFNSGKIEPCKDVNMEQVTSLVRAILDLATDSLSIGGYGSMQTEAYQKESISTIRMVISRITDSKTWNSLMHSPTKDFILDVFSKKTDGTSRVESAESLSSLTTRIGTLIKMVGSATEDVKNATLESLLKLKEPDAWQDAHSHHPTHKPIALMEYLVKLVTPEGATVLDPFMGSGTTGIACRNLNFDFIGIEMDAEYLKIAEARINSTHQTKLI